MDNFFDCISSIQVDNNSKEHQFLKTGKNVFIIGQQLSGKSTLANALKDRESLFFKNKGKQYTPVKQDFYPISSDDYDGTKQPKSCIIPDYQIWDFPGYGKFEDKTQAIVNRIQQLSITNKSLLTHIIMVFPYSQFNQDRGQNIIEILNLFDQNDLPASIIISKAPPKAKLTTLIDKLQSQLSSDETIFTNEAKDFLKQVIENKRIQLFHQPELTEDNQYQFQENNIQQIRQLVFDQKWFHHVQLKIKYLASDELIVNELGSQLLIKLNEICNQHIEIFIRINLSNLLPVKSFEENQNLKNKFNEIAKQMDYYTLIYENFKEILQLEEWNNQIQQQKINKVREFFELKNPIIIENKLYVNCSSYSLSELKKIYEGNQKIQEIYIYSLHQFIVDCDVVMPGVHIYIKCQQFRVIKKSLINIKGSPGQSFLNKARNGDETNIHGEIGEAGGQGGAGGILYVDADEHYEVSQLTVDISGGDGGNGQDGGDGCDGIKGEDGNENDVLDKKFLEKKEKVPFSLHKEIWSLNKLYNYNYRSKGKEGTVGGDAGCGGKGGAQGHKGCVKFEKLPLINLIENNSKLGNNGRNGKPGKGGQYGTDYIGQFQVVKIYGVFKDDNDDDNKKQDQTNETKQAVVGGVVGAGVTGGGLGLCLLATTAIPAIGAGIVITAGLHGIFSGIGKAVYEGWNYTRKDEENKKFSASGKIRNFKIGNQRDIQSFDAQPIIFKSKNRFTSLQQEWIQEIQNRFEEVNLTHEQIRIIKVGVNE